MAPFTLIVRRTAWLVLLVLAGGALFAWSRRRTTPQLGAAPEWPPLEPDGPATADEPAGSDESAAGDVIGTPDEPYAAWVEPPGDGSIPAAHPVKVNLKSGVFHVPGGRFYDRTNAQRYYATAEAAVADGYRQSKS